MMTLFESRPKTFSFVLSYAVWILGGVIAMTMSLALETVSWAAQVSPTALSFSAMQGGANPASQIVNYSKIGKQPRSWTASADRAWVTVSPQSGTIATEIDQMTVGVNTAGLAAGTYSAVVTIRLQGEKDQEYTTLPISVVISPPPILSVTPTSLSFSATAGGANPAGKSFTVSNTGGGTLSWTASETTGWLSLTSASGTNSGTVNVAVSISGLAAGTYNGNITVSAPGAITKNILVSLVLSAAASPIISVTPTSLSFSATAGGSNPAGKSFTVSNTGGGTLTWTASETTGWLSLTSASGTNSGTVNVAVLISGLVAGTYNGNITVSAPGATTKSIPVSLVLTTGPVISVTPTSLSFSATVGGANPTGKSFTVSNTGGGTLSWMASENAGWLSLSPVSGTNSGTVNATVSISGLAAGTYNGNITVSAPGATTKTVSVTLVVSTTTTGTVTLAWNANTETDLAGYKVYRGTTSGSYGAPIAVLSKTTTSYAASSLQSGTTHFFVVTAYDTSGNESSYSNEVSKSVY